MVVSYLLNQIRNNFISTNEITPIPTPTPTKELVITCAGGIRGALEVTSTETLEDVRARILEELDSDLILPDFGFHINEVRVSQKQEKTKRAWDILESESNAINSVLSIRSKRGRSLDIMDDADADVLRSGSGRNKRVKLDSIAASTNAYAHANAVVDASVDADADAATMTSDKILQEPTSTSENVNRNSVCVEQYDGAIAITPTLPRSNANPMETEEKSINNNTCASTRIHILRPAAESSLAISTSSTSLAAKFDACHDHVNVNPSDTSCNQEQKDKGAIDSSIIPCSNKENEDEYDHDHDHYHDCKDDSSIPDEHYVQGTITKDANDSSAPLHKLNQDSTGAETDTQTANPSPEDTQSDETGTKGVIACSNIEIDDEIQRVLLYEATNGEIKEINDVQTPTRPTDNGEVLLVPVCVADQDQDSSIDTNNSSEEVRSGIDDSNGTVSENNEDENENETTNFQVQEEDRSFEQCSDIDDADQTYSETKDDEQDADRVPSKLNQSDGLDETRTEQSRIEAALNEPKFGSTEEDGKVHQSTDTQMDKGNELDETKTEQSRIEAALNEPKFSSTEEGDAKVHQSTETQVDKRNDLDETRKKQSEIEAALNEPKFSSTEEGDDKVYHSADTQMDKDEVAPITASTKDVDNESIDFPMNEDDASDNDSINLCDDIEENEGAKIPASIDANSNRSTNPNAMRTEMDINLLDKDTNNETKTSPNDTSSRAMEQSHLILDSIKQVLDQNPMFCSEERKKEWSDEISELALQSEPKLILGVLGNTGVGKSSLLNALLDEASVLPTSGSRGCTATVVELRYNAGLNVANENDTKVDVYKGEIEFITCGEWLAELKILVDECSNQTGQVYAREPDPQSGGEAAAAWSKIDQVYGRGTMSRYKGDPSERVLIRLSNDFRVKQLLTPSDGSSHLHNVIPVQEGEVMSGSSSATALLGNFEEMSTRMKRLKKKWAMAFRSKINSYVYRKGNGSEPQTWPLIRKVVLYGPWSCLSSGACLVDLPGVRDANAARAKVSQDYLQNCNKIWIVAPIKRAVDDGTAKELLGEQFKRRLLMDGNYGNVCFICTQTDDCESTEIMRDHADVAINTEGRWEKMNSILNFIGKLEKKIGDLREAEEDLKNDYEYRKHLYEDIDDQSDLDTEHMVKQFREESVKALRKLEQWRDENSVSIIEMQEQCQLEQRELKTLCAIVRNEYSTKCLQDDFKEGLKALYRRNDEGENSGPDTVLPEEFEMDVHCISSNDYLKINHIKPQSDGPPSTFSRAEDTQIPQLRRFVHKTTARSRKAFAKNFVRHVSDLLDRVKLLAIDADIGSGKALRCMRIFERKVTEIGDSIRPLMEQFSNSMKAKVDSSLQPALKIGAKKGISAAMPICESWGSKNRRTRHVRDRNNNGLYYATYQATARRQGTFTSASAGAIDLNQELCDPMEKEFSVEWQRIMDSALRVHLAECESQVHRICSSVNEAIAYEFAKEGIDKARVTNISGTAMRGCTNAVNSAFQQMRRNAVETQRNLNRSLLPTVQAQMADSFTNALNVERGAGTFNRMKNAMQTTTQKKVTIMFDESTLNLIRGIDGMVKNLVALISKTDLTVSNHLKSVYSICWDQSEQSKTIDPELQRKIRASRDALLPVLNTLFADLGAVQDMVGIKREALDIDIMAVESLDTTIQKKLDKAEEAGEVIDLCDSDEEIEDVLSKLPPAKPMRIKADPGLEEDDDLAVLL